MTLFYTLERDANIYRMRDSLGTKLEMVPKNDGLCEVKVGQRVELDVQMRMCVAQAFRSLMVRPLLKVDGEEVEGDLYLVCEHIGLPTDNEIIPAS